MTIAPDLSPASYKFPTPLHHDRSAAIHNDYSSANDQPISLSLLLPSSLARIQLSSTLALTGKRPQKPMSSKLIFRGLKRRRVKVEIEDGRVLQISGEGSVEKEDKNDTWHRVERSSGKFLRRFRLP
ncbi:hypothetical protein DKX38_013923 [Salix brachista]|uniref:SHSP domain-containing protein n=1 Tax=Salix brachista TaxID=2182728 RepID=A0A5N5LDV8_9ROSI|nr:hypothetical protein DKX38_013923 [Salix brachista]